MSLLADWEIVHHAEYNSLIRPFIPELIREVSGQPIISYGLSSYGYDARTGNEFHLPNEATEGQIIDPLDFDAKLYTKHIVEDHILIPPLTPFLCGTLEVFNIPRDIFGLLIIKSTWARCASLTNAAWLEPEWNGHLTLEFFNSSPYHFQKIYVGQGLVQISFFRTNNQCQYSYNDRKGGQGKYQGQDKLVIYPRGG